MCGFAGILRTPNSANGSVEKIAERMVARIVHRGPDDAGLWSDPEHGVAFGFRRLAIIDLSELGHQPMVSGTGRFVAVFNGEIYNHRALRSELEASGCRFRGHSDTEVMLAAFERHGVLRAVQRFVGMFAIALWDNRERRLHLIRDRLGIKPLYIQATPGRVIFGSELKALAGDPEFVSRLDRSSLATYFRHLYIAAPRTIFENTYKLLPGHILTIGDPSAALPESQPYWSVSSVAQRGAAEPFVGSDANAIDALDELLTESVRLRLEADVPLGALLSGGIDSSTVVALMKRVADGQTVRTYTIGFDRAEHDESAHAKRVAQYLGTEHTELPLTGSDALEVIPRLSEMYDEPHADPSQIPTYLVSQLARRHVTVALSGDGGDELFCGYNRYHHGERWLSRAAQIPRPVRGMASAALRAVSPPTWDRFFAATSGARSHRSGNRLMGERMHKIAALLEESSSASRYRSLMSAWQSPERVVPGGVEIGRTIERVMSSNVRPLLVDRMMLVDQLEYLPDDLLAKLDRASMAVSLEARVPLLDHRVVEFAWRLPLHMKIRDGVGKWILRQVLYRYVPRELVERPKMGFSVPIETWLRGPLRPWAEELLSREALEADGILDADVVRHEWQLLLTRRRANALAIWAVVMFQAWRQRWLPKQMA